MAEIIDLAARKVAPEDEPHLAGSAVCVACGYEWAGVAPVGTSHLTCPKCDRLWGQFKNVAEPPERSHTWRCYCGNELFYLTPAGPFCRGCGIIVRDWV